MKVQKIVSLTPETAEIASKMENFSGFIRSCLMHYEDQDSDISYIQRLEMRLDGMKRRIDGFIASTGVEAAHMIVEGHRCPIKPEYR